MWPFVDQPDVRFFRVGTLVLFLATLIVALVDFIV